VARGVAELRRSKPDVILATHVGMVPAARLAMAVQRSTTRSVSGTEPRLLCWLHGVEAWGTFSKAQTWGLGAVSMLLSSSDFTLQRFYQHHPQFVEVPGRPCLLPARPLGDNPEIKLAARFAETENAAGGLRSKQVLSVGRLWGRGLEKGQTELLSLWPQLHARHPTWNLVIAGDGNGRSDLMDRARSLGVEESVLFPGAVDDRELANLYANSDIFALPSRGEGFGLVLAEAMERGVPCIASSLDAGCEVVDDGVSGLHVDPNDPEQLFAALDRLMSDDVFRRTLGRNAASVAKQRHSMAAFRDRIASALGAPSVAT
jgi:phosphatidyl-myo-inositol dimannoside synthase